MSMRVLLTLSLNLFCFLSSQTVCHGWGRQMMNNVVNTNKSNKHNIIMFHAKEVMISAAIMTTCSLQLLPQTCFALDLQCPQSFATQSLGIQNIIIAKQEEEEVKSSNNIMNTDYFKQSLKSSSSSSSSSSFGTKKSRSKNNIICNTNNKSLKEEEDATDLNNINESIQGLIYLPSSTSSRSTVEIATIKDSTLVITVSSTDEPSKIIFGAKIPMSQVQFPINFRLGKNNKIIMMTNDDDNKQVKSSSSSSSSSTTTTTQKGDLYITAKICPSSNDKNLPCNDSDSLFFGRGISKMLVLPAGGDDEEIMFIRAATSIRLSQSSIPDIIFSW